MAVVLGLLAALAYGASDFIGGHTTKRSNPWTVVALSQTVAMVGVLLAIPFLPGRLGVAAVLWGGLAGLGSAVGSIALYRGLATARMNVVAPLSGVMAAAVPVIVGLVTGERPHQLALIGVVIALVAIVLVSLSPSADGAARSSGVVEGLVAGGAFALLFIGLQRPGSHAGIWPLAVAEVVAVAVVVTATIVGGYPLRPAPKTVVGTGVAGILAFAATLLYLLSTRHGLLSIVAVLVSLYPALTVILAAVVLHERSTRIQLAGMLAAIAAVALIAVG
ncbi:MAG TPA: DMT family transporter [Mycobacteriales bacterium]|jgi:drug/metabolite transporter (DMT)-like permease|nr:DMT family transporter [Mycobacteriales bacterium]